MRGVFWLFVLGFLNLVCALRINEILYDPLGDEPSQEFVEVYSLENLSGYVFGDKARNQTLRLLQWTENPHALIVTESYDRSNPNFTLYTTGSMLGNGLSNSGDAVFVYFNSTLLDRVEYNKSAVPEGFSLERTEQGWEPSYFLGGTPGQIRLIQNMTSEIETEDALEEVSNPPNITLKLWTDKLIYKPGEKMKLALEWSEPDQTAQLEIRTLEGEVLRSYEVHSKLITYKITRNTSALWVRADALNFSEEKIVGVLLPSARCEAKPCPTKSCPKLSLPKESTHILSFYTRTKKYQEKIRLYSSFAGEGRYMLILQGPLETLMQNITLEGRQEQVFETRAVPGRNLFALTLENVNESLTRALLVTLADDPPPPVPTQQNKTEEVRLQNALPAQEPPPIPVIVEEKSYDFVKPNYLAYGLVLLFLVTLVVLLRTKKVEAEHVS